MKWFQHLKMFAVLLGMICAAGRPAVAEETGVLPKAGNNSFERLVIPLIQRGDTKTANEVSSLASNLVLERSAANMVVTIGWLEQLRAGHVNAVVENMETALDNAAKAYSAVTNGYGDASYTRVLNRVKEYRAKYPHSPTASSAPSGSITNQVSVEQCEWLVASLKQRGELNTANEVVSMVADIRRTKILAEMSLMERFLERLRAGKIDEVIQLLEVTLDGDLITFMPPVKRPQDVRIEAALKQAKAYRTRYPYKSGEPAIDDSVARALATVPE